MNGATHTEKSIDLVTAIEKALVEGATFCAARFPGLKKPKFYTSLIGETQIDQKAGFAIHPWPDSERRFGVMAMREVDSKNPVFQVERAKHWEQTMPLSETTFEDYQNQFKDYQDAFEKGRAKKAILSRIKVVEKPTTFNAARLFDQLCQHYPAAFVYIYTSPQHGLWMGASPELLMKKSGNHCETVSLAGTKPSHESRVDWSPKEIEEQELVSEHIRAALLESGISTYSEHGPETLNTGTVSHLKTTFRFELDSAKLNEDVLIKNLHPTPAVAGLPVNSAIELIAQTEKHERGLYTGYLGRIDGDALELYVNLRCMQVGQTKIALYIGGGITASSDMKAEWEETEHKAQTLLKFLHE
jgi:isochorismate synthase